MDPLELAFAGIARQAELIRAREVSARELVELYLQRIARLDTELNAVRVVFAEQALAVADAVSASGAADGPERPLLGVPVLVKDDVDVAGEVTGVGTGAYGAAASADSEAVRRLRSAGAIVLGKTNVPELTLWPFTESATWGRTRNPWDPDLTPGGSSGGSAAAVAAGLAGAALGSDGLGSIRIPAACCALFGLKPQRGRVSLAPRAESWYGLTVLGPLARSVKDGALLLDALAGPGPGDATSAPPSPRPFAAFAGTPPGRLRIAASTRTPLPGPLADEAHAAYEQIVVLLGSLGHDVRPVDPDYGSPITGSVANGIVRYLRGVHDDAATMARPERLERRTRAMARVGGTIPDRLVAFARAREKRIAAALEAVFAEHDVLLTPALAELPPPVGLYEGRGAAWTFAAAARFTPYTAPWNVTGQPACSVPAGFTPSGVPLAVQLVGRTNDEGTLLTLAAQLESERPWAPRRPPVS